MNEQQYFYMIGIATQLDQWADEAKRGGWSTQHVKPMEEKANEIRRKANQFLNIQRAENEK